MQTYKNSDHLPPN